MLRRYTIEKDMDFLRQISLPVNFQEDFQSILKDLKEYCETSKVYALAPIQIGIPKRIIYIKNSQQDMSINENLQKNENIIYLNPRITEASGHTTFLEACESCQYQKNGEMIFLAAIVDRPYKIKLEYDDIQGKKHEKIIEGFEVTIICHEYDHLNGILHLDRTKSDIIIVSREGLKKYRNQHPYEVFDKKNKFTDYVFD